MYNYTRVDQYPWYIPAVISSWRDGCGKIEPLAHLYIESRAMAVSVPMSIDPSQLKVSHLDDVIDTFLSYDNLKIVAQEGDVDGDEVSVDAEFDDIDDLVTEELAEIYRNQGLYCEAIAIYTKLSLLNSEKSAYFAEQISTMNQNAQ